MTTTPGDHAPLAAKNVYLAPEATIDPGPPRWFAPEQTSTFAVMLGSGKPEPTPFRNGPSGAIVVDQTPFLIDAGEGVWRSIAKAAMSHDARLATALEPNRLTRVFLTHLHSDYCIGLPNLMFLPWTCGKERPLEVYGPVGTRNLVEGLLQAYEGDVVERVYGPEKKEDQGWRATAHEIESPGVVFSDSSVEIEAFFAFLMGGLLRTLGTRSARLTARWCGQATAWVVPTSLRLRRVPICSLATFATEATRLRRHLGVLRGKGILSGSTSIAEILDV